ncbi:MAG: dynamin family protein [Bosea sp. (in: a-proteobacteria)]|uniref:dynamin family protein n=1 Tax=Bosea sp. (in: a-proteobacteria) TaxID=1871050 RepID=UPI003F7CB93E
MDLQGYERAKFDLSGILQKVISAKLVPTDGTLRDRLQDLLARLAEDRFNLVVAGRFNRGKSTLMNAILGADRLPTGIVPLTSVITTVAYGTTEKVRIKYRERRLDTEIGLEDLPQYVTQEGNPGNSRGIASANIELPVEILRRGFHFVDTPGLGSVIAENTATTKGYLPEADALLLVTSFESPLSEEELAFFFRGARVDLPIFVIVNKQDLATSIERDQAIAFVHSHLPRLDGHALPEVFSVSARDALAAKLGGDAALLARSGIPALEERLVRFLLEQKRTVFLAHMARRIGAFIDSLPSSEEVVALKASLNLLCRTDQAVSDEKIEEEPRTGGLPTPPFSPNQLRSCEICAAVDTQTWHFLARYQYALSVDGECQKDFANHSGFCCYHTAEYETMASPFGTCSGYPPLLERLAAALRKAGRLPSTEASENLRRLLPSHGKCVACTVRDETEARLIAELAQRLRNDSAAALDKLSGLCLPHLSAVADEIDDEDCLSALLDRAALSLERTAEDMRRFTLKQSAIRRHLETQEEETAAARGLSLLAGRQNVNFAAGRPAERGKTESVPLPGSRQTPS